MPVAACDTDGKFAEKPGALAEQLAVMQGLAAQQVDRERLDQRDAGETLRFVQCRAQGHRRIERMRDQMYGAAGTGAVEPAGEPSRFPIQTRWRDPSAEGAAAVVSVLDAADIPRGKQSAEFVEDMGWTMTVKRQKYGNTGKCPPWRVVFVQCQCTVQHSCRCSNESQE